ncbi:hypothetical protein BCR34DRAFT_37126 [Clohesyomyces aquaticus]|uniref:Uncharacterized protein n=1 Tax=Clohesyomyces aquaticus TaxID=1231657 RepID=A0A1Y2A4G8_9PLEO|nr:hypothetical protein BCR34DRAFT_37126 [Clohesyomyces aquaticus]
MLIAFLWDMDHDKGLEKLSFPSPALSNLQFHSSLVCYNITSRSHSLPTIRNMSSNHIHASHGRFSHEQIYAASDPELSTNDEETHEAEERAANDRRIHQAIAYISNQGGNDSIQSYANRLEVIDEYIIQQYVELAYSFDPKLYRQLKSMLRAAQRDMRNTEAAGVGMIESASEDLEECLSRRDEHFDISDETRASLMSSSRPPQTKVNPSTNLHYNKLVSKPTRTVAKQRTAPAALVTEKEWTYGGPNNAVEVWHHNFPPSLPFGETLFMQELESRMIDFDLAESAKKREQVANGKAGDNDDVVETNVPYHSVHLPDSNEFESGSRFRLPKLDRGAHALAVYLPEDLLPRICEEINVVTEKEQKGNGYAPRIFLEHIKPLRGNKTTPGASRKSNSIPGHSRASTSLGGSRGVDAFQDSYSQYSHKRKKSKNAHSAFLVDRASLQEPGSDLHGRPAARNYVPTAKELDEVERATSGNLRSLSTHSRPTTSKAKPTGVSIKNPSHTCSKVSPYVAVSPKEARSIGRPRNMSDSGTAQSKEKKRKRTDQYEHDELEKTSTGSKIMKTVGGVEKKVGFSSDVEICDTILVNIAPRPTANTSGGKTPAPRGRPKGSSSAGASVSLNTTAREAGTGKKTVSLKGTPGTETISRGSTRSGKHFKSP